MPGGFRSRDFLLGDEKLKVGKCELGRKWLPQSDQTVPDVFRRGYFLFLDEQTEKRQVEVRSGWQRLVKHLGGVSTRAPAKLKGRIDCLRIVREHHSKVAKRLFSIALNQEEIGRLPSNMRSCWIRFHAVLGTLCLLADTPRNLVGSGQIQPVAGFVGIQMNRSSIS